MKKSGESLFLFKDFFFFFVSVNMKRCVSFLISFCFWILPLSFLVHMYTPCDSSDFGCKEEINYSKMHMHEKIASETKTTEINLDIFYIYAMYLYIFLLQYIQK